MTWQAVNKNLHNSLSALTKHKCLRHGDQRRKTKRMTNNINGIHKEMQAGDQNLQTVVNFKYLGAIISDACFKADIVSRIAQCTTAMTILKPIWNEQNITLITKVRLIRTILISIICYACQTVEERTRGNEMLPPPLPSYNDHITNEIVCTKYKQITVLTKVY